MAENDQVKWRGVRNVAGDAGIEVVQDTAADLKTESYLWAYDYDNTQWRKVACDADAKLLVAGG